MAVIQYRPFSTPTPQNAATPPRSTISYRQFPTATPSSTGTTTQPQPAIVPVSKPPVVASSEYSRYVVMGEYYYGVTASGRMDKLNYAGPTSRPDPRYVTQGQGIDAKDYLGRLSGEEGYQAIRPVEIISKPTGSTKRELSAFAEAQASQMREAYNVSAPTGATWGQIREVYDFPSQQLLASDIYRRLLPQTPSAKYLSLVGQYQEQRRNILSSSGILRPESGDWRNITTGELFTGAATVLGAATPLGSAAAKLSSVELQLATMRSPFDISGKVDIGKITGKGILDAASVGVDTFTRKTAEGFGIAAGGVMEIGSLGKTFATTAIPGFKEVWAAGEYIGLDYLIRTESEQLPKQTEAFEREGLIRDGMFYGTDKQFKKYEGGFKRLEYLQGLQAQKLDIALATDMAAARQERMPAWAEGILTAGGSATNWLNKTIISPFGKTLGVPETVSSPFEGVISSGITKRSLGMIGTVATWPTYMMIGPFMAAAPEFAVGSAAGLASVPGFVGQAPAGLAAYARHPAALPGGIVLGGWKMAEGMYEGLTTRPVRFAGELYGSAKGLEWAGKIGYAASPLKYTSATFARKGLPSAKYGGLYAESPITGISKLIGTRAEFIGTRNIGGLTLYEGRPIYRPHPSIGTPSHLVEYIGEGYPDFPGLVVKVPLVKEKLIQAGQFERAAQFESNIRLIDEMTGIRPSTIKNPYEEITKIQGVTKEAGVEFLDTLKTQFPQHRVGGSLAQSVQSAKSRPPVDIDLYVGKMEIPAVKKFIGQWNKKYGTDIKVDIHEFPEPGSYIGRYGVRVEKDIVVEGVRLMPIREQALRKLTSSMMLRDVRGDWILGPEAHRGKDIADTLGTIESEIIRVDRSPLSFAYRGRRSALEIRAESLRGLLEPGALPIEQIVGRVYDPSRAAARRYGEYTLDLTPSVYTKLPFSQRYVDLGKYTAFESEFLNPVFQKYGIGMSVREIKRDPLIIDELERFAQRRYGVVELKFPTTWEEYRTGMVGGRKYQRLPIEEIVNFPRTAKEELRALEIARTQKRTVGEFEFKKYTPRSEFVSGITKQNRIILDTALPEYPLPIRALASPYPSLPIIPVSGTSAFLYPTPSLRKIDQYPQLSGRKQEPAFPTWMRTAYPAPSQEPRDVFPYPFGTIQTPTREGYPSLKVGKYPGIKTPAETPYPKSTRIPTVTPYPGVTPGPGKTPYPKTTIPQKTPYPSVRITGGGKKITTTIGKTTFGGLTTRTTTSGRMRETIPLKIPTPRRVLTSFTIPKRKPLILLEEREKKPKLKQHFDVLASKWIIESPVPRIKQTFGWGTLRSQRRSELKVFDIQRSRKRMVYIKHMPYEQFEFTGVTKL